MIVQARMGSRRLRGKVLRQLAGRPMLAQQLRRLKRCQLLDEIIVATTVSAADDAVVDAAESESVRWFRGSEQDVLSRFVGAARECHADVVVRVTADCPLIDPAETDRVIAALCEPPAVDYVSNVMARMFPRGLDTEAMFCDVLQRVNRLATSGNAREHVTYFVHAERPDLFVRRSVTDTTDNSDLRWTVDTEDDFAYVAAIYDRFNLAEEYLPYRDMLAAIRATQDLIHKDTVQSHWTK
jgi:spore coat polysaccharide biosynthesis protein SpsF